MFSLMHYNTLNNIAKHAKKTVLKMILVNSSQQLFSIDTMAVDQLEEKLLMFMFVACDKK